MSGTGGASGAVVVEMVGEAEVEEDSCDLEVSLESRDESRRKSQLGRNLAIRLELASPLHQTSGPRSFAHAPVAGEYPANAFHCHGGVSATSGCAHCN